MPCRFGNDVLQKREAGQNLFRGPHGEIVVLTMVDRELGLEVGEGKNCEKRKIPRCPYNGCAPPCRCSEGYRRGLVCSGCHAAQGWHQKGQTFNAVGVQSVDKFGDVVGLNTFNRARKAGDTVADELGG